MGVSCPCNCIWHFLPVKIWTYGDGLQRCQPRRHALIHQHYNTLHDIFTRQWQPMATNGSAICCHSVWCRGYIRMIRDLITDKSVSMWTSYVLFILQSGSVWEARWDSKRWREGAKYYPWKICGCLHKQSCAQSKQCCHNTWSLGL